jgi:hypothetical protein
MEQLETLKKAAFWHDRVCLDCGGYVAAEDLDCRCGGVTAPAHKLKGLFERLMGKQLPCQDSLGNVPTLGASYFAKRVLTLETEPL